MEMDHSSSDKEIDNKFMASRQKAMEIAWQNLNNKEKATHLVCFDEPNFGHVFIKIHANAKQGKKESNCLLSLRSTGNTNYFVQLYESSDCDPNHHYLLEEFLGRNLVQAKQQVGGDFEPEQAILICVEMIKAVQALQEGGVVHCNLRPSHFVFVVKDKLKWKNHLKIISFSNSEFSSTVEEGKIIGNSSVLYGSVNNDEPLSDKDEAWSLLYVMIQICEHEGLPWYNFSDLVETHKEKKKFTEALSNGINSNYKKLKHWACFSSMAKILNRDNNCIQIFDTWVNILLEYVSKFPKLGIFCL